MRASDQAEKMKGDDENLRGQKGESSFLVSVMLVSVKYVYVGVDERVLRSLSRERVAVLLHALLPSAAVSAARRS